MFKITKVRLDPRYSHLPFQPYGPSNIHWLDKLKILINDYNLMGISGRFIFIDPNGVRGISGGGG